jgi:DNA-binding protein Alba
MMIDTNTNGSINTSNQTTFLVNDEPVMKIALDVLNLMQNNPKIIISGIGKNCPNAVSVANIITENMLKENSKIENIIVDSDVIDDGRMISKISIAIIKLN